MKPLNFKECEHIKKDISEMSTNELNRFLTQIYTNGFNDCKANFGGDDASLYVWDDDELEKILLKHFISPRLAREIIEDLER